MTKAAETERKPHPKTTKKPNYTTNKPHTLSI
jgi:hypothetical protein